MLTTLDLLSRSCSAAAFTEYADGGFRGRTVYAQPLMPLHLNHNYPTRKVLKCYQDELDIETMQDDFRKHSSLRVAVVRLSDTEHNLDENKLDTALRLTASHHQIFLLDLIRVCVYTL